VTTLEDDIRAALHQRADLAPTEVRPPLARRATHRGRWVAAAAAMALVAGSLVAATLARHEPSTSVRTDQPVQLGATGITWRLGTSVGPAIRTTDPAHLDGSTYAVSLGNDPARQGRTLWASTDGQWAPVDLPDGLMAYEAATDGAGLYVVGTGPATVGAQAPVWVERRDAGDGWARSELPIDLDAIAAASVEVHPGGLAIAAGPKGIVAAAVVSAWLDVARLLPAGVTADGWAVTDAGVELLGPGTCPEGLRPSTSESSLGRFTWCEAGEGPLTLAEQPVVRRLSWAELGVGDDVRRAALGEPFVFHADGPGEPFVPVDVQGPGRVNAWPELTADEDGFDLAYGRIASRPDRTGAVDAVIRHSDDGTTWHDAGPIPSVVHVMATGRLDGTPAVIGWTGTTPVVGRRVDGRWSSDSLEPLHLDGAGLAAAIGPLGAAIVRQVGTQWEVAASRDGHTWSVTSLDDVVGRPIDQVRAVLAVGDRIEVTVLVGKALITLVASVG
jgi:hypothetical protein